MVTDAQLEAIAAPFTRLIEAVADLAQPEPVPRPHRRRPVGVPCATCTADGRHWTVILDRGPGRSSILRLPLCQPHRLRLEAFLSEPVGPPPTIGGHPIVAFNPTPTTLATLQRADRPTTGTDDAGEAKP